MEVVIASLSQQDYDGETLANMRIVFEGEPTPIAVREAFRQEAEDQLKAIPFTDPQRDDYMRGYALLMDRLGGLSPAAGEMFAEHDDWYHKQLDRFILSFTRCHTYPAKFRDHT
jgi:hypothetical protein